MNLLLLENTSILEQLRLEEALLRADDQEWCLINTGSPPAIVMGISGKPEKLLNLPLVQQDSIPVIKRFSGGGTVYIDSETVFVTFISSKKAKPQPKPILSWSKEIYSPLFPGFDVRENDYVFGDLKFGGNAQYIQKERWLHHTSFLWDYQKEKMDYLLLPEKRPKYRADRSHTAFLTTLRSHFPQKKDFIHALTHHLQTHVSAKLISLEEVQSILTLPHRKSTQTLSF